MRKVPQPSDAPVVVNDAVNSAGPRTIRISASRRPGRASTRHWVRRPGQNRTKYLIYSLREESSEACSLYILMGIVAGRGVTAAAGQEGGARERAEPGRGDYRPRHD